MPLQPGDKLGPYEILSSIGGGEWGRCIAGTTPVCDAMSRSRFRARSFRNGSGARQKRSPRSITPTSARFYDIGPNYLVMELVEGTPLLSKGKPGPLAFDEA